MSEYQALKHKKLFTLPTFILAVISFIALVILAKRFMYCLGSVTNLNDGYPWGIWVIYDVVVGTGFACPVEVFESIKGFQVGQPIGRKNPPAANPQRCRIY